MKLQRGLEKIIFPVFLLTRTFSSPQYDGILWDAIGNLNVNYNPHFPSGHWWATTADEGGYKHNFNRVQIEYSTMLS